MLIQIALLFCCLAVLLVLGEYVRHRYGFGNEVSRKLVHVLHGTGLAALAFIVPLWVVIGVEVAFLVLVGMARYLYTHYSRAFSWMRYINEMYRVGRLSYGEFFFPISTILCALLAQSKWVFAAALLVLGLADTIAALVGKTYGRSTSYTVFGQKKSALGSLAFFAVAFAVVCWFSAYSGVTPVAAWWEIVAVALLLTLVENVGVYGSDNFLIPLAAVITLNLF